MRIVARRPVGKCSFIDEYACQPCGYAAKFALYGAQELV